MSVLKQLGILVLLALLGVGGYVGWDRMVGAMADANQNAGPPGVRPTGVVTAPVEFREMETVVEAVGSTRARRSVEIAPLATGRVAAINFEAGQQIAAGQVLLRLDDDIQRADLKEAEARFEAAASALKRAEALRRSNTVAEAQIERLAADLSIAEADRDRAARRLRDRTVNAPFDGVVGYANVELGARINEGYRITTLDDLSVLEIEMALPEILFGRIGPGQPVQARAAAFPGRRFDGQIVSFDSRIDPVSRSFRARAHLANEELALPAGMFMHLSVVLGAEMALTVPEEAVVVEGANSFLFAVVGGEDDARVQRRTVRLGRRSFGHVEILDGVTDGDEVVIRGVQKVRDGSPVRRMEPAGAAAVGRAMDGAKG